MNKSETHKHTPFLSQIEWFLYYIVLPRNLTFTTSRYNNQEYYDMLRNALSFLEIIELRSTKAIPISFSSTIEMLKLPLLTQDPYLSTEDMNKIMLMTVIRTVNNLCDCGSNAKLGRSIAKILQQLDLKDYGLVSEVRHAGTHKVLPSIEVTQTAVRAIYHYLLENYWDAQFEASAPFLRDQQAKVYDFLKKVSDDNPNFFRTNIQDWEGVHNILYSKKGKQKVRSSEQIAQEAEMSGKIKMKRALKILDILNKMITYLKKYDLRRKYLEEGFEKDLAALDHFLRNTDRLLFQRYMFLQYRLKQIIVLQELHESFSKIIETLTSKIPSIIKDLEGKKKTPKLLEESMIPSNSDNEKNEKEETSVMLEEKTKSEWVPQPIGFNFLKQMNL